MQLAQLATPSPDLIPDYDLTSWRDDDAFARVWLTTHQEVHEVLRSFTGVTGVNLADVDLSNESEFYTWLADHAAEHAALRSAFGLTL